MISDEKIKPTSKTLLVIVDGQDDLHVSNIESIELFLFQIVQFNSK